MRKIVVFLGIFLMAVQTVIIGGRVLAMELKSPEFKNNEYIPEKFTYRGENINPVLTIDGIPAETKSIALILDDPDAPNGNWVHWVVFDIPVVSKIDEDSVPGKQGMNDFGRTSYDGPYPPYGTHRYIFKVYALNIKLNLKEGINKAGLEEAMDGHILAKAELTGLCKK